MRRRAEEELTLIVADSQVVAMESAQKKLLKGIWKFLSPIIKKVLAQFLEEFVAELLNNIKKSDRIDLVERE